MATDSLALPLAHTRPRFAPWVAEAAFAALLLLVFIGLQPFEVRNATTLAQEAGGGSLARQICYLGVFCAIIAAAYDKHRLDAVAVVPATFVLLLGWCFLSAAWAAAPDVTVRRAGLEFVIVLSAMLGVETIGAERALRLWRHVLAGILIINWVSIPILPQAVHLAGEADPSLVGDWRGLYFQKNITGAVCAISAMIFLYYFLRTRRWRELAFLVAALGFLAMTRSKASLGFLPVALGAGALYRWGWRRDLDRMIVAVSAGLLLVVLAAALASHSAEISRVLNNPSDFTGRTEIWQAELGYIHDHTWLGAGYGTFADSGGKSPLHDYVDQKWVALQPHGHNGYLQLLVTIGAFGFVLAMAACVAMPLAKFWRRDLANLPLKSLLFAIFVFIVLHNFLESDYLESDGPAWVALLIVIAMMATMSPRGMRWRRSTS